MNNKDECACCSGPKLVFSCSGAADVGELSDIIARQIHRNGTGKMFCMAGLGGNVSGIIKSTESASKILAIDGCSLDCTKRSLVNSGFNEFEHIRLTDYGIKKGNLNLTDELLLQLIQQCEDRIV